MTVIKREVQTYHFPWSFSCVETEYPNSLPRWLEEKTLLLDRSATLKDEAVAAKNTTSMQKSNVLVTLWDRERLLQSTVPPSFLIPSRMFAYFIQIAQIMVH